MSQNDCTFEKRYRVDRKVASGAFASVYVGRRLSDNRSVAIKKIAKGEAVCNEVVAMTILGCAPNSLANSGIGDLPSHPQLPLLLDTFESETRNLVVTDFCCGGDLEKWLKHRISSMNSDGIFPSTLVDEPTIKKWTRQLLSAVQFCALRGVLHCDIKPANILLTSPHDADLKLTDFGLAISTESATSLNSSSNNVSFGGTPMFMSPERHSGAPPSLASEVWALGAVLCCLVAGSVPWSRAPSVRKMIEMTSSTINFQRQAQWSPSDPLCDLIHQMLHPDPQLRISLVEIENHPFLKDDQNSRIPTYNSLLTNQRECVLAKCLRRNARLVNALCFASSVFSDCHSIEFLILAHAMNVSLWDLSRIGGCTKISHCARQEWNDSRIRCKQQLAALKHLAPKKESVLEQPPYCVVAKLLDAVLDCDIESVKLGEMISLALNLVSVIVLDPLLPHAIKEVVKFREAELRNSFVNFQQLGSNYE